MKNYLILFFVLVVSISCQKREMESQLFCNNYLQLFTSFDTLQKTNLSIVDFRNDYKIKLDSLFRNSYDGRIEIILNLELENNILIPLSLISNNSEFDVEDVLFTPRNFCHIYLAEDNLVFIEQQLYKLDSVSHRVENFYFERGEENYRNIQIALFWDKNVDKKLLSVLILESLKGYNGFAEKYSQKFYRKSICDLSKLELNDISKKIPFQLRIDFNGKNDEMGDFDYSPYRYVPPPPPMEDE